MRNGNSYDEESMDPTGWAAFIAGTLAGAGAALLFAPQSGTELRGMLCNYANRAKEALDVLMDKSHEVWETAVEPGQEYYDSGEEAVREAGRSAKEFVKQAQGMIREPGCSAL